MNAATIERDLLGGYTRDELTDAFERVQVEGDWKAPISKILGVSDQAEIERIKFAVSFFTATEAHVTILDKDNVEGWLIAVQADGYRWGPAGDH